MTANRGTQGQQRNVLNLDALNMSMMPSTNRAGETYLYPNNYQAQNVPTNCCPCIQANNTLQTQGPQIPEGLTYTFNPLQQQYALSGFM